MENSILLVGLGNPGDQYQNTRHNIGFYIIDQIQKEEILIASDWKFDKKFNAEISIGKYIDTKVYLLKPQTFMNLSGQSIALVAGYYNIPANKIWVLYDDKDLPSGKFRIRDMGSSGGHNGIKSTSDYLKTLSFGRFRIGIATELLERMDTSDFVLGRMSPEEKETTDKLITERIIPSIYEGIKTNLKEAQSKFGE